MPAGALSFGFIDVADGTVSVTKTVQIRNLDNKAHTYTVTPTFRFAGDLSARRGDDKRAAECLSQAREGKAHQFRRDPDDQTGSLLRSNLMNSGSDGANPAALTTNEYSMATRCWTMEATDSPRVARTAAQGCAGTAHHGSACPGCVPAGDRPEQHWRGHRAERCLCVAGGQPQPASRWPRAQSPTPDIRAVGINTFPVPAGFCSANESFIWAFAINTWERQQHLLPVSHQVWLDTNRDGIDDYVVLNRDFSGLATITDGRQLSWVLNLATGAANAFFFAEHSTNTGNTVLLICGEQIGMNAANLLTTQVNMAVVAQDFYYGGPGDIVTGLTVTPLGERFFGLPSDVPGNSSNPSGLAVYYFGPLPRQFAGAGLDAGHQWRSRRRPPRRRNPADGGAAVSVLVVLLMQAIDRML